MVLGGKLEEKQELNLETDGGIVSEYDVEMYLNFADEDCFFK